VIIKTASMDQLSESQEPGSEVQLNDYQQGDEEAILQVLSTVFPQTWDNIEEWRWKHCNRPAFKAQDIVTARVNDKMVACFHGATLPLKLEPGIVIPMSFDGDFAVLPENRGQHIPSRVHDLTDRRLKEAGVALRGGFTSLALNERFYHKQFGYVFIPTASTNFRKVIGIKSLREKIEILGEKLIEDPAFRNVLESHPMTINFEVDGFAPFHLHLSGEAFRLIDSVSDQADMYIKAPYNVIMNFSQGTGSLIKSALSSLLRGKFRIRGLLSAWKFLFPLLWATIKLR